MLWDEIQKILSTRLRKIIEDKTRIPSAVLLLLYEKQGETYLLFTKRTGKVADHKGQISFPGGVRDRKDGSWEITALRETAEEVGIDTEKVKILGLLDDCLTVSTKYVITPVLGFSFAPPQFHINPVEVEEVIEIPLAFFQDALKQKNAQNGEPLVDEPTFTYRNHLIWGATARILKQFLSLLDLI